MLDIYKTRYRLTDHPFRLNPDYRFSLDHPSYARAKAYLKYAISQGEGFIAITGAPGTGKTTLINGLLAELDKEPVQVATLTYAQLDPHHLIQMVATAFGLQSREDNTSLLLLELKHYLISQGRSSRHAVLIVDEAQGMSAESLEELRLLSNLQHGNRLLLQIFLVGQDPLMDMIHGPGMEHLLQRLIAASRLEPLSLEETVDYVEHRLCHVGWQGDPAITEEALRLIHGFSRGVPRRINLICHRLFLHGGLEQHHELTGEDVQHVVEELHKERVLPASAASGDQAVEQGEGEADQGQTGPLGLPRPESPIRGDQVPVEPITAQPMRHSDHERATQDIAAPANEYRPSARQGVQVQAVTVAMAAPDMPEEPSPAPERETMAATTPAFTEALEATNNDRAVAVSNHDADLEQEGHNRLPRRLLAVSALAASLLLALLFNADKGTETISRLRDDLASLTQYLSGNLENPNPVATDQGQGANKAQAGESSTPAGDAASPDTAPEARQPLSVEGAHSADKVIAAQIPDPVASSIATADVNANVQRETVPGLAQVETELLAKNLSVESVDDDRLKVRLSSEGMFEIDSTRLSESARNELARLAGVLNSHDGISLLVVGHTDSRGHPQYNLQLSMRRAREVADYLIETGIPAQRIRSVGRGDLDTRYEEATRGQPDLRRRVEIYLQPQS